MVLTSMISKIPDTGRSPNHPQQFRSIANNLAVLHILVVFISFLICSVILYFKLLDNLNQENNRDLRMHAASVMAILRATNGQALLEQATTGTPDREKPFMRVLDRQGRFVLESSVGGRALPEQAFPPPGGHPDLIKWRVRGVGLYLLQSVNIPEDSLAGPGGRLQIGVDISDNEALAKQFRNYLVIFILGGLSFSVLGAKVMVNRSLKPIGDMSEVVGRITRQHLHTRIDLENLPVEIISLADSFNLMLGRLEESFASLSEFSANIAHELRTPINNLMIEAGITLSRPRTAEAYQEAVSSFMEEYERLSWIIERLLFLARAEGGHEEIMAGPVALSREIEEIRDFYAEKSLALGVAISGNSLAEFCADPVLFRRALSNLVDNALRYTPPGGSIVISARKGDDRDVLVSVSDTGCGIPPEHLPKILDRFYRADPGAGGPVKGSGLGLAIVRAIMKMHGGDVDVQSSPGSGTTVTMAFPEIPT